MVVPWPTIAAGGQEKYLEGFEPRMTGFKQLPFGDHKALEETITPDVGAILIEPVQGEGGIRPVPTQCLKGLRELCDKHGILLLLDEVQCVCGAARVNCSLMNGRALNPTSWRWPKASAVAFHWVHVLATENAAKGMVAGYTWLHLWRQPACHCCRISCDGCCDRRWFLGQRAKNKHCR